MNKNDITVADVLKYEDIKDIPFLQIYAGVGSGKNFFVEQFIKGNEKYGIPKKTILIITSRRAKVDQTLANEEDLSKNITAIWNSYHRICNSDEEYCDMMEHVFTVEGEWGTHYVYQKSMVCTNAFIEVYQKEIYHPQDRTTHLWELFDMIVVDEVHSVIMDATYQSAPFYVQQLVNEVGHRRKLAKENPEMYKEPKCKQIILMTGTPDSIQSLNTPKGSVTIDLRDQCRSVQPQKVQMVKQEEAKRMIAQQLAAGERVVYFSNHTQTPTKFCEGTSIDPSQVGVSFSKLEKKAELQKNDNDAYLRMLEIEQSIREEELLPQSVRLFVTTTKNKEGINLQDKDIPYMYVESHIASDIIQAAGRIREGVRYLYIVEDAQPVHSLEWSGEEDFSRFMLSEDDLGEYEIAVSLNNYLWELCRKNNIEKLYQHHENAEAVVRDYEELEKYITYVQSWLPSVCYSYFRNRFYFYEFKSTGKRYDRQNRAVFREILEGTRSFERVVHTWFPDAQIVRYFPQKEQAERVLENFLSQHPNNMCTEEESRSLVADLNEALHCNLSSINSVLKKFTNWRCKRKGHDDGTKSSYGIFVLYQVEN